MKKVLVFGIVVMLVIAYSLTKHVSDDKGSQERTEAVPHQQGSGSASIIKGGSLTPKLAKEITVMQSASDESVVQDESTVIHLGEFIDPDNVADIIASNSAVQHLGEELDPEWIDERSPLLSARHLGDDWDPERDWHETSVTGLKQEIGDYIDADSLFLDFTPQPDAVPTHLGEDIDPESYL